MSDDYDNTSKATLHFRLSELQAEMRRFKADPSALLRAAADALMAERLEAVRAIEELQEEARELTERVRELEGKPGR